MCVRGPLFLAFWWVRSGETAEPLGETRQIDKAIGPLRHTGPSAFLLATFSFFLSCWGDTPRGGAPSPRLPPAESGTASALPGTSAAGGASPRSVTTGGRDPAARLPLRSGCPPISSPKGPQGGQPPVVWVRAGGPERCCEAGGLSSSQERACEPGGGGHSWVGTRQGDLRDNSRASHRLQGPTERASVSSAPFHRCGNRGSDLGCAHQPPQQGQLDPPLPPRSQWRWWKQTVVRGADCQGWRTRGLEPLASLTGRVLVSANWSCLPATVRGESWGVLWRGCCRNEGFRAQP